jgi:Domain of unknown function (DUF222)
MFDSMQGMDRTGADEAWGSLPDGVEGLDAGTAGAVLGRLKVLRGFLDAYEARITRRLQVLAAAGKSAATVDVHARRGGLTASEARRRDRRAEALAQAPALAERLAVGALSAAHADAFADACWRLEDRTRQAFLAEHQDLAARAAAMTPEEFARVCRQSVRRLEADGGLSRDERQRRESRLSRRVDLDGMYRIDARLHPEAGQILFGARDREATPLVAAGGDRAADREHLAARALVDLARQGPGTGRPAEAEIRVHVDAETLVDPGTEPGLCEYEDGTPVPPSTVRRFACHGRLVPIVIDTDGVVLDAGREQRLANRDQRRALRAMYRTCAVEGCEVAFSRCEIHHARLFDHGGDTDLADLAPLCSPHHHQVHQPGWTQHLAPDRTYTITTPAGTTTTSRPPPPPPARRSRSPDGDDPPRRARAA